MFIILTSRLKMTKLNEKQLDIPMEIKSSCIMKAICTLCTQYGLWLVTLTVAFGQSVESVQEMISESTLRAHIRFLADDLLEGRGPASQGDALTQLYLETQFQANGLEVAPALGSYRQVFPMLGLSSTPEPRWEIQSKNGQSARFEYFKDFIAVAGKPDPKIAIKDAELVFVGYGIQAPEFQWDDYKGMDLKGKILVMMNNDPEDDPELFAGSKRLYYGRWDYKYESAARQGAAGAIIIHTDASAGYPFTVIQTSWSGEEFELKDSAGPRLDLKGWMTETATRELFRAGGFDLDQLRQTAEQRDFKPVPLGLNLSTNISCSARERVTANVLGILPGSDPKLSDEYVVFMAHHDHIGMSADRDANGDNIYNGAIDNASGTASLLTILRAIRQSGYRPKRSLLFAAVGAEEQGLLGSKYLAENPPIPNGKLSALINIDGINFLGPTRDVQVIGLGKSSLDQLVQSAATKQGRIVVGDLEPSKGYYYRSDQFSLAKVGVPAVYLHSGHAVRNQPEGWGKKQLQAWTDKHYHQRSDQYDPSWDLSGAIEDIQLLTEVGLSAADAQQMQSWTPGDEFQIAREQAIQKANAP
jgi:Zn-dependent M28 family amino/carboxypeptidase